jgi:uncharacterized repeat protein (TIGR03837 family)
LTRKPTSVDIFCRVVDNYGDIGVTWRLARQLTDEYGFDVRLFVDDLASVEKIVGESQYNKLVAGSAFLSIIRWKSALVGEFDNSNNPIDPTIEYIENTQSIAPHSREGEDPIPLGSNGTKLGSRLRGSGDFCDLNVSIDPAIKHRENTQPIAPRPREGGDPILLGISGAQLGSRLRGSGGIYNFCVAIDPTIKHAENAQPIAPRPRAGGDPIPLDSHGTNTHPTNASAGDFRNAKTIQPADIVIEAFACELPTSYIDQMAARAVKPLWLNLEYLSAEPWVAEYHLLPSPHPRLDLTKHFFFPGFTDKTGGLIREKSVQATPLTATPALNNIFVFGYDSPHSRALISSIANTDCIANITIAEGALADASKHLPTCVVTPFVPQPDFDSVLATHDFCWVRGEDSFVRAQYAGKPFIWQIYPQEEGAHLVKLQAFLDLYCAGMSRECTDAVRALNVWLSDESMPNIEAPWQNALTHWQEWQQHAHHWQKTLLAQTDLATKLVSFYQKSLII